MNMRIASPTAAVVLAGLMAVARPAAAQGTLEVETTEQHSTTQCTLSDAIKALNTWQPFGACASGLGKDTILLPAGTFTLTSAAVTAWDRMTGLPHVTRPMKIIGAGPGITIIRRNPLESTPHFRIFQFDTPFTLEGMTLANGHTDHAPGGGALLAEAFNWSNNGTGARMVANIHNVVFENNHAPQGGAIADSEFWFGPYVEFNLTHSQFIGNTAGQGGAILLQPDSAVIVRHSFFYDNRADNSGGAIFNYEKGIIDIEDATFEANKAIGNGGAIHLQREGPRLTRTYFINNDGGGSGGALYAYDGRPVITDSSFTGNSARHAGAIHIIADGSIEIRGSTFAHNVATDFTAGVLAIQDRENKRGPSVISNSTFSANQSVQQGGAIYVDSGWLYLNNVTMTDNAGDEGPALSLGWWGASHARISNSIIAGNFRGSAAEDIRANPSEDLVSLGHNLIGSDQGVVGRFTAAGDRVGTPEAPRDPGLMSLAYNGGLTWTHALKSTSEAVDNGSPAAAGESGACEATDQRGAGRPGTGSEYCDIGAFEGFIFVPPPAVATTLTMDNVTGPSDAPLAISATLTRSSDGTPIEGRTIEFGFRDQVPNGLGTAITGPDGRATIMVSLPVGEHIVGASFHGVWELFHPSGAAARVIVEQVMFATTLSLTSSAPSVRVGDPVTFTATVLVVAPGTGTPTGQVSFSYGDGIPLGDPVALTDGVAELPATALPAGTHTITAVFTADSPFLGSSNSIGQEVRIRTRRLTVRINGEGSVAVQYRPQGGPLVTAAACHQPLCEYEFPESSAVQLEAVTAGLGSRFVGWTGCSSPSGQSCSLVADNDAEVTAQFEEQTFDLRILVQGRGAVTFSSGACSDTTTPCDFDVKGGTVPMLSAVAAPGYRFVRWLSCPSPTATHCVIPLMDTSHEITVVFERVFHPLTISITGRGTITGTATVPGEPVVNLACSDLTSPCTIEVMRSSTVVLTGTPARSNGRVSQWLGCDAPSGNTCTLTMLSPRPIEATFVNGPNRAPVARITRDFNGAFSATGPLTPVPHSGLTSSDPDGDALAYRWSVGSQSGTDATFAPNLSIGSHQITLTVFDPYGLSDTVTMRVRLHDVTPPVLSMPLNSTIVISSGLTWMLPPGAASAVDAVDGSVPVFCEPIVLFLGENTVRCSAQDAAGNRSRGTATITIRFPLLSQRANELLGATQQASGATAGMLNNANRVVSLTVKGNDNRMCGVLADYSEAVSQALRRGRINQATAEQLLRLADEMVAMAGCVV